MLVCLRGKWVRRVLLCLCWILLAYNNSNSLLFIQIDKDFKARRKKKATFNRVHNNIYFRFI